MLPNYPKALIREIQSISATLPGAIRAHINRPPQIHPLEHPILAFPGIGSPAFLLRPLVEYLKLEGHNAHTWGSYINLGPTHRAYDRMEALTKRVFEETGVPITGIGHSLGALFHLHLARLHPERYQHVIGLAGPCELTIQEAKSDTNITIAFHLMEYVKFLYRRDIMDNWQRERDLPPISVPRSMIIAARDGIVSPLSCELPDDPLCRNFYVDDTHGGLLDNPIVHALTEHLTKHGNQVPIPPEIQRHLLTRDDLEIFQKVENPGFHDIARGARNFIRSAIHR